jgi:4-hydroxythreonine-4-phosphate dehydrogenase
MTLPIIGITMGDPVGIGPEIIVKALCMEEPFKACRPIVFGDRAVLEKTIDLLSLPAEVQVLERIPEGGYLPRRILLFPVTELEVGSLRFARPDRACGMAMVKYVQHAVEQVMAGKADAITTCPFNKRAVHEAGFSFSGHTELLAHLTKVPSTAMMFVGSRWRIVLVTTHLPLKEVPKRITKSRILTTLRLTNESLKRYFGITHPKIALLGLNPHCGEEGLLGEEETTEIIPALMEARLQGVKVEGPFPADSFFDLSGKRPPFDAVISMYHDQGLIPIKTFNLKEAVNLTLGLPFIRTSVAHGTAYDIAGKGMADPTNLVQALLLASRLTAHVKS